METCRSLNSVHSIIEKTFPIPGRFRNALPSQIAQLSALLTNKRGDRSLSYLSRPNFLSAYLYFFLPWNLYRLCILLPGLDISLKAEDTITDLGCGPLTFISALWLSRPDLRNIPLEINCIDRSAPALEAGKKFFSALCENTGYSSIPWKINTVKEDIDLRKTNIARFKKSASLVCAVNLFNEIYEKIPHSSIEGLKRIAENTARIMHNQAEEKGYILTVEPGVPQSGKFISFLRGSFMELGRKPLSPCTHTEDCPLYTEKKRWCHFGFETGDAPKELLKLSKDSGLPKERLVYSYLLTGEGQTSDAVRIISDPFPLPDSRFGRYGCCGRGLVLLSGNKSRIEKIDSGSCVPITKLDDNRRDKKSGACIMDIC